MSHKSNGRRAEDAEIEENYKLLYPSSLATSFSGLRDAETERIHKALFSLRWKQEVWIPGERPELGRLDRAFTLASDCMEEMRCPAVRVPVVRREPRGSLRMTQFTVILHDCEEITRRFGAWIFGEVITFNYLFRTPAGPFVEYSVNLDDTTLELRIGLPILITEDEAAGWFPDPESAPEYLRPLAEKRDLTKIPADRPELKANAAPSGNGTATNGRAYLALADGLELANVTRAPSIDAYEDVFKKHTLAKPILELLQGQAPLMESQIKAALELRLKVRISDSTLGKAIIAMRHCESPMIRNQRKGKDRGYSPST
jgi:hypothetical protein